MSASATRKLEQAELRLQHGDIAGAQALCEQVLQRSPQNPDALFLMGMAHLMAARPEDAVPLLEKVTAADPQHGAALENLGFAHLLLGRFARAEQVLNSAIALPGAPASVFMRLGIAMLNQGKSPAAIATLQQALKLEPQNIDCHLNLGQAYAQTQDIVSARSHFESVLRLEADNLDAIYNLGVIYLGQDDLERAQQCFERVHSLSPRSVDALINLGIILQKQGQLEDAAHTLRRALELHPNHPAAGNNLAHTLTLQNRLDEARAQYLLTLRAAPDLLEAHEGLASVCFRLGRLKEAVHHLHQLLLLDGESCGVHTALANALFQDGQLDQARAAGERALTLDPGVSGPYAVLALIHIVRKEYAPAIALLEAGFERTRADNLLGMLAHLLQRVCDWEKWGKAWQQVAARLDQSADLGSPFWLLTADTTAHQQLAYTRRWAESNLPISQVPARSARSIGADPARRLRVAYLSSDLHEHATAHLLAGVLEQHDRTCFEIFAYSHGPEDGSATRVRIKQACEHFVDVAWEPDDVLVRRIEDDAIDILVDLKGYTVGARTAILARRPCPVQINWLGYPGTMGAAFIDYLIADDFIVPPGSESAYAERVLHLAPGWQCNDRSRPLIEPLSRTGYGLPQEGFVFCCFNQAVKITPEVFASWMRLLRRVARSVLWLAEDNPQATHNLLAAAIGDGIDPQRLVFAPRLPYDQHLARYRVADLALDTFPYTSHTTASDALWLGCPLVALCGETFAARVSGSILRACGLPELITGSLPDYENLTYRFAADPDFALSMRARLATARLNAPLFDATAYARNLERLYLGLVPTQA